MLYSFYLYAITNNEGLRTAINNLVPDLEHPSVFTENSSHVDGVTEEGDKYIFMEVKYHAQADRDTLFNSVKGLSGVLNSCLPGSYMKKIKDYDDETAWKPSEIEFEEYA